MYINTKIYKSILSKMSSAVGDNGGVNDGTQGCNNCPNGGAQGCNNALNSGVMDKIGIKMQRRIETDERIFRAAVIEFANKGYGGAKIADIAKTANISPGLIIQNYGGKEDLFMAITECFVADLYSSLDPISAPNSTPLHAEIGDWRSLLCEIINITKERLFTSSNPENPTKQRLFASSNPENSTKQRLFTSSDSQNSNKEKQFSDTANSAYSPQESPFASDIYYPKEKQFADADAANYTQEKQFSDIDTANLTRFFITALNTKSTPQKALDLVTSEFLKTPIPAAMKQGQSDGELVDGDTVDIYNLFFRTMSNILAFCSANNTPLPPTDWFLQLLTKQ